ncbi:3'-5' exonuclease [Galbitalea sp. SE-J8]|uniref:3'-5' exonuclease n=1 Tax=Galbitalea sp. SE-J8 TaxID=3054952 RepID=UPI00259CC250|nr:3'-5' exonuclease [Galbitalea sp. SE-J8]MDM4762160.1 3'-5' exonuclease [Galbitalea sp. SE-J8]
MRTVGEEADEDSGFATPNAVTITTVHRSKGMQWPAVFIPCLRKNRFPMRRQGGLNLNLDAKSDDYTARVDDALLAGIKSKVQAVASDIRAGHVDCGHDHSKEGAYNDSYG